MLSGEIRNQVDQIWNAFWAGGVSNLLSVIEQITYCLFPQAGVQRIVQVLKELSERASV